MIEHACELSLTQENELPFAPIKPFTFKNAWLAWCGISKYTPRCNRYMDSTAIMTAERKRHTSLKHWWIIHPFSYVR